MSVTLYRLEGCPYCELVANAIGESDVAFDSVWVEALHSKRDEVKSITGQRRVPVLVDDRLGVSMSQSRRILEYLATTYGGVTPADAETEQ